VNQGWKDSWDGITSADGRPAEAPIALCEVQGYVYDAYRSRAELARMVGEEDVARGWDDRAAALKAAFNERFWLPERGWFALALDRDERPVDACASNMGHCLWSGIVDEDKGPLVAEHLLSPAMFSGWGVRTLSSAMGAYDPVSYHNGSVWPHDNALVLAGLMRYGFVQEAQRVAEALLEAAQHFGGRLPELFCGFRPWGVPGARALPDLVLTAGVGLCHPGPGHPHAAAVRSGASSAAAVGPPRAAPGLRSPPCRGGGTRGRPRQCGGDRRGDVGRGPAVRRRAALRAPPAGGLRSGVTSGDRLPAGAPGAGRSR
jgi:hypothetical protein